MPSNMTCTAGYLCDNIGSAVLFCEVDRFRDLRIATDNILERFSDYTAFSPKVVQIACVGLDYRSLFWTYMQPDMRYWRKSSLDLS